MSRWTEQTEGARAHNEAQARQRAERDEAMLVSFERVSVSVATFAASHGMSRQRMSVILRRAREAREAVAS
jgi:hypothetical protein